MTDKAQLADFARRVMDLRKKAHDLIEEIAPGDAQDWLRDSARFLSAAEMAADEAVAEARQ